MADRISSPVTLSSSPLWANSHAYQVAGVQILDCNPTPTDGALTAGNHWNCNLCQTDLPYFMPVSTGRRFHIQTQFVDFYNSNPEAPTAGWGSWIVINLYNAANNLVVSSTLADMASRWGVGWNGESSYQIIEIDPSLPAFAGLESFYFEIRANQNVGNPNREVTIDTQHYRIVGACDPTVLLRGTYPEASFDCLGNYYGAAEPGSWLGNTTASFLYRNDMLVEGALYLSGASIEKSIIGPTVRRRGTRRRVTTSQLDTIRRFNMSRQIAPYMATNIIKQVLSAQYVLANGTVYELDSFSVENKLSDTRMFLFDIDLTESCDLDFRCRKATSDDGSLVIPEVEPPTETCITDCTAPITCIVN